MSPWRRLTLALLAAALLGAAESPAPRPEGTTHADAVAMALELALVAPSEGAEPAGGMDEARTVLGLPDLAAGDVRDAALAAAGRWAGRIDPARRLWFDWPVLSDPAGRLTLLERSDPEGSLARLAVVGAFCDALLGSRHLPIGQAADLLARATAQRDAEAALELAGRALEGMSLRTVTAQRQAGSWAEMLSIARLPGPLPWDSRIAAHGQHIEEPMAVLVRIEADRVLLGTRTLLSWQDGAMVQDVGPVPEALERWSPEAWGRWRVIARRRGAVALAGVTTLPNQASTAEAVGPEPLLVADPDLPLLRLAEVLGWLADEGEPRACLLTRDPGDGGPRRACFALASRAADDTWLQPDPSATAQDFARALEEGIVGVVVP